MTSASVKRSPDPTGDDIATYQLPDSKHAQAIVLIDSSGALAGTLANPLQVGTADEAAILAAIQALGAIGSPLHVITADEASILAAIQALGTVGSPLHVITADEANILAAIQALGTVGSPLHVITADEASILAAIQALGTIGSPLHVETADEAAILTATQALAVEYAVNDVASPSATITYVGKESQAGAWLVQKVDTTSGVVVRYASIANNALVVGYAAAWAARAGLTYGTFSEAM